MTATALESDASTEVFFFFKIHGLPYYFFSTVDPTDAAKYGASAWTLPAGYSAVKGMHLPEGAIVRSLQEILGGFTTAPRTRLRLTDFEATDSAGRYLFLSRLFATGRVISSTAIKFATLASDLSALETTSFDAKGPGGFAASGDVYVGAETIGYASRSVAAGTTTFSTLTRNKYPCHPSFPPVPFHRVARDSADAAIPSANVPVTSEPVACEGRLVALYVCHMKPGPGSIPEAEVNAACVMIGRVRNLDWEGPTYALDVESIEADLEQARPAEGLARAELAGSIYLKDSSWRTFVIGRIKVSDAKAPTEIDGRAFTIDLGDGVNTYATPEFLCATINKKLGGAGGFAGASCHVWPTGNGERRVQFMFRPKEAADTNYQVYVAHGKGAVKAIDGTRQASLLCALGFPPDQAYFVADTQAVGAAGGGGEAQVIAAPRPPPRVFIPTAMTAGVTVQLIGGNAVLRRFFTNQGDGSGRAWVRLSDGQIVQNTTGGAPSTPAGRMTLRERLSWASDGEHPFFYASEKDPASLEQVLVLPDPEGLPIPDASKMLGQLLASTKAQSADDFNVFPEGVGLGFNLVIDKPSWRIPPAGAVVRRAIIDRDTTFGELAQPIFLEYGLHPVWDPKVGALVLRRSSIPTSFVATTPALDQTNRCAQGDGTPAASSVARERSMMHLGYVLRWGWDSMRREWVEPALKWSDDYGRSLFGVADKDLVVEDKTLPPLWSAMPAKVFGDLIGRSVFARFPWQRLRSQRDKTWLLETPGRVCKIVDPTVPNPFTGAMGIADADGVYGLVWSVAADLATGRVDVDVLLCGSEDPARYRIWSPTARVDFDANAGGFTNGYNAGAKQVKFVKHYTARLGAVYDGIDFAVGDKVRFITRDNYGAATIYNGAEIAAVAADGLTVTLVAALGGALSNAVETVMVGERYTSAVTAQKSTHAYQGAVSTGVIQATSDRNHKWG